MYFVSVVFAFRFYSPERYYSYGMRAAGLGLLAATFGLVGPRLDFRWRRPFRNLVATLTLLTVWCCFGNGVPRRDRMAMRLNYNHNAKLWRYINGLPPSTRIASFPRDGDDIPLFAQRSTMGGYETMQPWLTGSWARQKERAEATLRALYATKRRDVLAYASKYHVTHFLVNRSRYGRNFVHEASIFQPLTDFARNLLRGHELKDLVLADIPASAVVFRYRQYSLVDIAKLRRAWASGSSH